MNFLLSRAFALINCGLRFCVQHMRWEKTV